MAHDKLRRRKFLRGATVVGGIGLVGCMGNPNQSGGNGSGSGQSSSGNNSGQSNAGNSSGSSGGGGSQYSLRVGTSSGGTYDVGLAVERAVSQHSDSLSYSTVESPGYIGTIRRMAQGQFNAGITDNNSLVKALNDRGTFSEQSVDQIPQYGFFAFPYSIYVIARDGTDIETFDDLAGKNVYPAEPGYSTRATTLDVWSQDPTSDVYDQMNIQDLSVDDAPGALAQGQIDASIAYGTPPVRYTGFVQEMSSRANLHYVEPTDALMQSVKSYAGAGSGRTAYSDWGIGQDIGTDEVYHWDLQVNYTFTPSANNDAVYELCRVVNEHNDAVNQAQEQFNDFGNISQDNQMLASALEQVPVHPGAAQYYKDNNAWNNNLQIGSDSQ